MKKPQQTHGKGPTFFMLETYTTRKTVIGSALSAVVYLEPLLDHISTAVQDLESLLKSDQLISSGSSLEPLLIITSSEADSIQNQC
jgi:hypothetical protein